MPSANPIIDVPIMLTKQPDGRWRANTPEIEVRRMRVAQAAISLVVDKLFVAYGATRTETHYVGPGTNYGQAGLYHCRLFSEPQQPKG